MWVKCGKWNKWWWVVQGSRGLDVSSTESGNWSSRRGMPSSWVQTASIWARGWTHETEAVEFSLDDLKEAQGMRWEARGRRGSARAGAENVGNDGSEGHVHCRWSSIIWVSDLVMFEVKRDNAICPEPSHTLVCNQYGKSPYLIIIMHSLDDCVPLGKASFPGTWGSVEVYRDHWSSPSRGVEGFGEPSTTQRDGFLRTQGLPGNRVVLIQWTWLLSRPQSLLILGLVTELPRSLLLIYIMTLWYTRVIHICSQFFRMWPQRKLYFLKVKRQSWLYHDFIF